MNLLLIENYFFAVSFYIISQFMLICCLFSHSLFYVYTNNLESFLLLLNNFHFFFFNNLLSQCFVLLQNKCFLFFFPIHFTTYYIKLQFIAILCHFLFSCAHRTSATKHSKAFFCLSHHKFSFHLLCVFLLFLSLSNT